MTDSTEHISTAELIERVQGDASEDALEIRRQVENMMGKVNNPEGGNLMEAFTYGTLCAVMDVIDGVLLGDRS